MKTAIACPDDLPRRRRRAYEPTRHGPVSLPSLPVGIEWSTDAFTIERILEWLRADERGDLRRG